jgi:hypothetical protein
MEAFLEGHFPVKGVVVFADAATPRAGEIAAVRWFKHQHEGVGCFSPDLFIEEISCHGSIKTHGKTHGKLDFLVIIFGLGGRNPK